MAGFEVSTEAYIAGPAELKKKAVHLYPVRLEKAQALPSEVPKHIAKDFWEAYMIQNLSPKASAALSRRLLQRLFHDHMGIKARDLNDEIETAITDKHLPAELQSELHAVRTIGNFGAHPIKVKNTGEIADVEPGEAEWQITILRHMFDEVFVKPAAAKKRLAELNKKLSASGKPEIK
jgi:hypothetical protein